MIHALAPEWQSKATVIERLREDMDLLKDDIWKLFEYEGEGDRTLANVDRWDSANWSGALVTLSKEGKLSRNRLLDSSLGALELGFNHYRARWFFDFFDLLEPTDAELKKRAARILGLMDNPAPNVAQWAFDKQAVLLDRGLIKDVSKVIEASAPLLGGRAKKTVVQVLRLFGDVAEKSPKVAQEVCLVTAEALAHDKADVQKLALKLIKKHGSPGDAQVCELVQKYGSVASATVKKDIKGWLGSEQESGTKSNTKDKTGKKSAAPKSVLNPSDLQKLDKSFVELMNLPALLDSLKDGPDAGTPIPAATFDGTDFPRLDPAKKIEPITDFNELLEALGRVIEDDSIPDEAERAIDGLARLNADKPADFEDRVAPLFKRATRLLGRYTPFSGQGYIGDICGLICAWKRGEPITIQTLPDQWGRPIKHIAGLLAEPTEVFSAKGGPLTFLCTHLLHLCLKLPHGEPIQLLSAPTHEGGWIAPGTLVQRVNKAKAEPDELDVVLALLRLAPDGRAAALKKFKPKLKGEWVNAVKHGLGGGGVRVGKTAALWAAAARCRVPLGDDAKVIKAFPKLGPGAGAVARFSHKYVETGATELRIETQEALPKEPDTNLPSQLLQLNRSSESTLSFHDIGTTGGSVKWLATLWPSNLETYFTAGAACLGSNLDWWEAAWHNRCFLEPMLDSDIPMGAMGELLLMCGLAAKEPGEHGLATDIAMLAINDGRLGTENLGNMLADGFPSHAFNLTRLSKRLADIAGASELHAYVVMHACEVGVAACYIPKSVGGLNKKKHPRGLGDILEVMLEVGTELSRAIVSSGCRAFLEGLKGSNKSARAAKRLLDLDGGFDSAGAITTAAKNRMERVREWSGRK